MDKKLQCGRIIMLLLTSFLLLSACGIRAQNANGGSSSSVTSTLTTVSTPTPSSSSKGTLVGSVMAGPACPGPVADSTTCPDKPVIHQPVQIMTSASYVLMTVTTDQRGQFTIALAPGHYLLRVNASRIALRGTYSATPASILANHTTSLRITLDTEIR